MPKSNEASYRHAKYYADQLDLINKAFRSGLSEDALADFDANQIQIEHGYQWADGMRDASPRAKKLCALYPIVGGDVLMLRQPAAAFLSWNSTGLEIAEEDNNSTQVAGFLVNLGWSSLRRMEYDTAKQYFHQALERATEEELSSMTINPHSGLAPVATEQGLLEEAIQFYQLAINIWRRRGDMRGLAGEYGNIGIIYTRLQNMENAQEYVQQAVVGLLALGDTWRATSHLNNLGIIYSEINRPLLAIKCLLYSMRISQRIKNLSDFGKSLAHFANLQIDLGHLDKAQESLKSAIEVAEHTNDSNAYNMRLTTLARLHIQRGDFDEGFRLFRQSMKAMKENGKRYEEAAIAGLMGKAYADLKDYEQAITCFEDARDIFQELGLVENVEQANQNIEVLKLHSVKK